MLVEFRTLVAVSRYGTFASAGDHIGLTQAAVSGHIKRLEQHLGFALFDRTGRSARLNAHGERTLARAREILGLVDAIDAPEAQPFPGGRLRIGAIASLQSTLLAKVLARFREIRPGCHIRLVPGVSLHLLDQLDADELDLAVIIEPPFGLPPQLAWHEITREPYVLLAPKDWAGDDWRTLLRSRPFLRYERVSFGGRQVDRFLRDAAVRVDEVMELDDLETMTRMVAAGVGVALAPRPAFAPRPPRGVRVVSLGDQTFDRKLGIAIRRDRERDSPSREALEAIVAASARSRSNVGV